MDISPSTILSDNQKRLLAIIRRILLLVCWLLLWGVAFDPATAWDDRKQLFMSSGLIIKTTQVTQSATGDKNGLWTSVVAAAVFLPATSASVQELLPPSNQPAV